MLSALLILAGTAHARSTGDDSSASPPFTHADIIPDDVSLYLQLHNPQTLRRRVDDCALARWAGGVIGEGALADAWQDISATVGLDAQALFDRYLGENLTIVIRDERPQWQWAMISHVPPRASEELLRRLKARIQGHRSGIGLYELPEHDLQIAVSESIMLIGPKRRDDLYTDIATAMRRTIDETLAGHEAIAYGRSLDPGTINVYLRHKGPVGGWSVTVGRLNGQAFDFSHEMRFDRPPRHRGATEFHLDHCLHNRMPEETVIALTEPTDLRAGRFEAILRARLDVELLSPALRESLAGRQLLIVGSHPAPLDENSEIAMPSLTRAYELVDDGGSAERLHDHMHDLLDTVNRSIGRPLDLPSREMWDKPVNAVTSIDLAPLTDRIIGSRPAWSAVTVSWAIFDGPGGRWLLLGSHADHVETIGRRLSADYHAESCPDWSDLQACGTDPDDPPRWLAFGQLNAGQATSLLDALGTNLEAWAHPGHHDRLARSIGTLAELTGVLDRVQWRMRRPASDRMHIEVRAEMATGTACPETAAPPQKHEPPE